VFYVDLKLGERHFIDFIMEKLSSNVDDYWQNIVYMYNRSVN